MTIQKATALAIEDQRICSGCVAETFLRAEIERRGQDGSCFYCELEGRTFTIGEMANEIEIALDEHYYRTASEPSYMEYLMSKDADIGYDWEREGDTVASLIGWCAKLDEEPAEDIRRVLAERHYDRELDQMGEENPFDEDAHYAGRGVDDAESQAGWLHFEESLTTEARYFNPAAEATLTSTFEGIAEHRTHDDRPVIVEAGPGTGRTTVYRARVFQSDEKLVEALKLPDKEIGPPPPSAEYLPTQAIADFLATRVNPALDGILYPSVQGNEDKINVVQFHKASRVEPLDIPEDAEISVSLSRYTDEGPEIDYWVFEEVPRAASPPAPANDGTPDINDPLFLKPLDVTTPEAYDAREAGSEARCLESRSAPRKGS